MAQGSSGGPLIAAAVILAAALVGASYWLAQSIDRGTAELAELGGALKSVVTAQDAARPSAPSRSRRPDPDRVYQVAVGDAPYKGSESAPITVVEWADFQ